MYDLILSIFESVEFNLKHLKMWGFNLKPPLKKKKNYDCIQKQKKWVFKDVSFEFMPGGFFFFFWQTCQEVSIINYLKNFFLKKNWVNRDIYPILAVCV